MSFLYFLEDLRNPVLDYFFSFITLFGEETIFMAVGMIVFWCVDKFKGYYILCVGFFGTVLNQFLKIVCRVPRPWVKGPHFTIVESAREAAGGYSFPSGHTQTSVGLYGGIARITNNKALRIAMIILACLVALSRMYLGVHTPADVLVSVAIATILIFVAYPIFRKAEKSPKVMYALLFSFLGIMIAYLCFVHYFPFPSEVYAAQAIHNLESARKNGFTLLGCAMGLIVVYTADLRWIKFETKAVFWAQILKVAGGLILVVLAKELLRAPLDVLFNGSLIARSVRYFIMVIVGGALWPMTFRFFARLGKSK
ncbi:MAG: phosphatase PAP2 family protein [Clostridia bacterium]|nr:phosphatase PAP2 family protein [Clostridia bacterium]